MPKTGRQAGKRENGIKMITILCYAKDITQIEVEKDIANSRRKIHPMRVVFPAPTGFSLSIPAVVSEAVKPVGHYWIEGEPNGEWTKYS